MCLSNLSQWRHVTCRISMMTALSIACEPTRNSDKLPAISALKCLDPVPQLVLPRKWHLWTICMAVNPKAPSIGTWWKRRNKMQVSEMISIHSRHPISARWPVLPELLHKATNLMLTRSACTPWSLTQPACNKLRCTPCTNNREQLQGWLRKRGNYKNSAPKQPLQHNKNSKNSKTTQRKRQIWRRLQRGSAWSKRENMLKNSVRRRHAKPSRKNSSSRKSRSPRRRPTPTHIRILMPSVNSKWKPRRNKNSSSSSQHRRPS